MNAADPLHQLQNPADREEAGRIAALNTFAVEAFQNLHKEDLLLAQAIAGHGDEWGFWRTPEAICKSELQDCVRTIDFAKRIRHFISKQVLPSNPPEVVDKLVEEGVLVLTRLALLMRLAPTTGNGKSKNERLKTSSSALRLYNYWPAIVARSILRKQARPDAPKLLSFLTEVDVREFAIVRHLRIELDRLATLTERGWWTDLPPHPDPANPTDPSGPAPKSKPEDVPGSYQPISDRYLEAFGPRNLWVVRELGPYLLPLLEDLATHLEAMDCKGLSTTQFNQVIVRKFISQHLQEHPWLDSSALPLKPSFPLQTGAQTPDKFQFPPSNWEQLKLLSATLQAAHLFLTLLASAGRIGEVYTLSRSCVITARDGKGYLKGWTYKLSSNLFGDERQWPAPTVLVHAIGQQKRLAEVWLRLPPKSMANGLSKEPPAHNRLWLSLGLSQKANSAKPLKKPGDALRTLATRIGMDPQPGGINLHPHRLRKTIGRLAGIALFNSPTVLKRLFGHKCIEMTLRYILCDKDVQLEAEAVLRELRIMHCAEALEEIRDAIASGSPLPAHSGAAAPRLAEAVIVHEARLNVSGRLWREGSAYDLAYLLTARGQGWRFAGKYIICAKAPGEKGHCANNRGEPNTSNCKPICENRFVLASARRDADENVRAYMDIALRALEEEQFETFYYSMTQLLKELENFAEIKDKYMTDPQLQPLLSTYKELDQ